MKLVGPGDDIGVEENRRAAGDSAKGLLGRWQGTALDVDELALGEMGNGQPTAPGLVDFETEFEMLQGLSADSSRPGYILQ